MRIFKSHPLLKLVNSYIIDSPQPSNLSYLWNFGSLLAVCLVIQIITGVTLAMHYNPSVLEAFNSVEHIMRDVNNGWLIRYLHSNTASAFFFLVYLHMGRGLYYGSYRSPRTLVWILGTVIFLLMIITGFLGKLHSPKWFKFNNNNNNKNNNNNNFNSENNKGRFNNNINKYPFFPEHYEQIAASSQEATNEAIWLTQQDNSLQWDAPTTEGEESFYLELFREKEYTSVKGLGYSPFSREGSKRGFCTSSKKLNISNKSSSGNLASHENVKNSKEVIQFLKEKNLSSMFVYENLEENFTKTKIRKDTLNLSGIYLILNKFTLDYYIGSASTNKFYSRFSNHLLNFKGSKVVKAAVKKYKITSFAFIILELFPEIVSKDNNKQLLDIEDFYLKSLLPNYNILTEAGNSFGYKHSEITRIIMKNNYSIERRLKIGNLNKDRIYTDEEREKLRIAAFNRKKAVYSEEAIMNMKKKSKAITIYNFDDTVYGEFSSIIEAAKVLNCDQKTIARALKTPKQILRRRWIVKYSSK
jgi:group I intron endonuclease